MKQHARDIVVECYNLSVTDEMLSEYRVSTSASSTASDATLRARIIEGLMAALLMNYALRILEGRVRNLIGTKEKKDTRFIYGRGTVSRVVLVVHIC